MKKYARIIDEKTKICIVGVGTDTEYYESIGMELMDVEQGYDGNWYLEGYAPVKPEPTTDEKKAAVRAVRDSYINGIEWRVSRYRDQKEIDVPTTDSEETYMQILRYMQYLRDYPNSSADWYEGNPLTFEEWIKKQNN